MIKQVIFFNNFHNGDIHYSREFIKFLTKKFNTLSCAVAHHNCESLLKEIGLPLLKIQAPWFNKNCILKEPQFIIDSILFFNTWIGQTVADDEWYRFNGLTGACTLTKNYKIFKKKIESFGIDFLPEHEYIPNINYDEYNLGNTKFEGNNIFISNGPVLSGQSSNFDMTDIICRLADKYKNCNFYVTQNIKTNLSNIIDANIIFPTKLEESNLIQLSRLSNFCKIIIGRGSGPFCFAHVKQNLFDNQKTFIGIGHDFKSIHWATMTDYDVPYRAKQLWTCDYTNINQNLYDMVCEEINEKFGNR